VFVGCSKTDPSVVWAVHFGCEMLLSFITPVCPRYHMWNNRSHCRMLAAEYDDDER
jgi:hypothetical protein